MDKLKLYEVLGARRFQKVVFRLEKVKFKIFKPFSKYIINLSEKRIDKKIKKTLLKVSNEDYKRNVISYYNREKLRLRIELNSEKNRNYHMNFLNPKETIGYLNINKDIHIRGVKSNILCLFISSVFMVILGTFSPLLFVIALAQVLGLFVNFECINLQNYNILRIERKMEKLVKIRERKIQKKIDSLGNVSRVVSPLLTKSISLPKKEDIVTSLSTLEELEEMKVLLEDVIREREGKGRIKVK